MWSMSETFVDLSYRGLALGTRIKLTQVRAGSGYLEMPQPMPVGSTIGIATDEGVMIDATVAGIHEQVTGSDTVPGMLVRPSLEVTAAEAWWTAHASLDSAPPVNAPAIVEDGRTTAVMSTIVPDASSSLDTLVADMPDVVPTPPGDAPPQDETRPTMMMDAVDLAALGLATQSGQMAAVKPEDYADDTTDKPEATGATKAKKKRTKRR
jgi:hypothetical protein